MEQDEEMKRIKLRNLSQYVALTNLGLCYIWGDDF